MKRNAYAPYIDCPFKLPLFYDFSEIPTPRGVCKMKNIFCNKFIILVFLKELGIRIQLHILNNLFHIHIIVNYNNWGNSDHFILFYHLEKEYLISCDFFCSSSFLSIMQFLRQVHNQKYQNVSYISLIKVAETHQHQNGNTQFKNIEKTLTGEGINTFYYCTSCPTLDKNLFQCLQIYYFT